ncbi:MAG: DMT family transporter [Candidatus Moraniibacteriota bacterium]
MGIQYAILFGLIAMVGSGLSGALAREPVRALGSDRALFWRAVAMVLFQVPLLVVFFPRDLSAWGILWAIGVGAVGYLPIYFFFRAISRGRVGVVSPISNSSSVITAMLAVFVLGEPFGGFRVLGLLVALSGIILLSVDFRDWKNSALLRHDSGIPFAVAACLGWGIVMFLFRYPVLLIGPIFTAFIIEAMILLSATARLRLKREPFTLPKGFRVPIATVGFFGVIGVIAYDFGLTTSAVAVVAILNMTNPVVAAAYEHFAYGEKLSAKQYVGIALAIAGAVLVSLAH